MMGALTNVATVAGYLALAQLAWQFLGFLRFNLRGSGLHRYGKSHRLYKREPAKRQNEQAGPWALVTGASDGLGLTFANELAARGFNLIIHGRNPQKLDGIKASLVKKHANIHVRTLVVDGEDHRVYDADTFSQTVLAAIGDIPLTLLVNNISVLGTWTALHERTPASLDKFLNLNIRFLTRLTALAIPVLQRHSPALILNISSGASHVPLPWSAPYAGVKAYSESLHRSLRYELRFIPDMKDVEVLTLEYGTVCTPSTGRTDKDATWDIPTTEHAVRAGLGCVGSGQTVVVPYWGHQVQAWLAASLPRSVADNFVAGMMREQKIRMDKLAEGKRE